MCLSVFNVPSLYNQSDILHHYAMCLTPWHNILASGINKVNIVLSMRMHTLEADCGNILNRSTPK